MLTLSTFALLQHIGPKKNQINSLEINGNLTNNLVEIRQHIVEYYKDLLCTACYKYGHIEANFCKAEEKLIELEKWKL